MMRYTSNCNGVFSRLSSSILILVICLFSCKPKNDLQLEKVFQSSDHLKCDKVFANSRKSIVELNEILVQTGVVDTSEIVGPPAAVIHVQGKEIILNLIKGNKDGDNFNQLYAGKDYKLLLNYKAKHYDNRTEYVGYCEVWHQTLHSKFDVEGLDNTL
ncbi:hypothetical protein [Mucilaginibacter agri]|uniref:Uncharacterized protein n=1 Tax=Mucilaginibacter agri TaxID=2695265 RepID=A0A965ZH86_9SPHI|nr:hypothetical protein [Mucilaginibacter agri]NCD69691.1 hypothetical protein [Mucilaginibacter agri]